MLLLLSKWFIIERYSSGDRLGSVFRLRRSGCILGLKAKAIIYRPFRFAECSLFELDIQTPPEGEGGEGVGEETAGAAGEACARLRVPGRPLPGRLVTTLCSKDAGRAPLF